MGLGNVPDMGVKVRVSRPTNATKDLYEDVSVEHAATFQVIDGRLFLFDGTYSNSKIVSVYNADAWLGAWLYGDALKGDSTS